MHGAADGDEVAGFAGIGEERHGRLGVNQNEMAHPLELGLRHLGQIGQAVHRRDSRAAFEVGREGLAQERGTGGPGHAAGRVEAVGAQGPPAQEEGGPLA